MFFNRTPHPDNFTWSHPRFSLQALGEGIFRLKIEKQKSKELFSLNPLKKGTLVENPDQFGFFKKGIHFKNDCNETLLQSSQNQFFGVSQESWMFSFQYFDDYLFYGMGEKNFPLERSGRLTRFWNTDVWGDFELNQVWESETDPMYASVPYILLRRGNNWLGVLIETSWTSFMATGPDLRISHQQDGGVQKSFFLGADGGNASLCFIRGKSPLDITQKYQELIGTSFRPPLWALGYHQSRWGYRSKDDLNDLAKQFKKHKIPCSALWLDIDYMRGFRVFTWNKSYFPNLKNDLKELKEKGFRVIPILDPGVKKEKHWSLFQKSDQQNIFCKNSEGQNFTGLVWPGKSCFPDFSLEHARVWWSEQISKLSKKGIDGVWIDMNDPSTGAVDPNEMLFQNGKLPHAAWRNEYATGMALATYNGFLKAHPKKRPFVLSRSGSRGIQKFSALWTGDNMSNYFHLKRSIAVSLNLALSGIPFNGPDVPGFGGNATASLFRDWVKTCFLFPFFRNHSVKDSHRQEPWAFDLETMKVVRKFIRLRYRMLPYLYQLFIHQEERGEPILRPLFMEFPNDRQFDKIEDEFFIGSSILQAPFVDEKKTRFVFLPTGIWFDYFTGEQIEKRKIKVQRIENETPIFIRDGSILALQRKKDGEFNSEKDALENIEFRIFLSLKFKGKAQIKYCWDDGESFAYRKGKQKEVQVIAWRDKEKLRVQMMGDQGLNACFREVKLHPGHTRSHQQSSLFGRCQPLHLLH